jgi:hypothetical protein
MRTARLVPLLLPALLSAVDAVGTAPVQDRPSAGGEERPPTWEMPAIEVRPGALREEDRIGSNGQPRWTAHRRFDDVPVYVLAEGEVVFQYWLVGTDRREDQPTRLEHAFELEFGLPWRFQLGLYHVEAQEGREAPLATAADKVELRWALADWEVVPGNPTLHLEYSNESGAPDLLEGKLLVGGELAAGWHWATNLALERRLGGERENAYGMTNALSYTIRDGFFALGAEDRIENEREETGPDAGLRRTGASLGPDLQLRPTPRFHVNAALLFALNEEADPLVGRIVVGYEF